MGELEEEASLLGLRAGEAAAGLELAATGSDEAAAIVLEAAEGAAVLGGLEEFAARLTPTEKHSFLAKVAISAMNVSRYDLYRSLP